MVIKISRIIYTIAVFSFFISCNNGPKKVEAISGNGYENKSSNKSTGIFSNKGSNAQAGEAGLNSNSSSTVNTTSRTIEVLEVLPTDKYVYLKSKDGEEEFWVASLKQDVKVGDKFTFKKGLLKTNFESKEYNRVFDKVYLVSNLTPVSSNKEINEDVNISTSSTEKSAIVEGNIVPKEGSITIAELVDNPETYKDKEIQLTGRCVKLNPNIMGRNWIHLQDDTKNEYDLVITSDVAVPVGHIVTLTGIVTLDKDFGAGYKYDLIVENADLVR